MAKLRLDEAKEKLIKQTKHACFMCSANYSFRHKDDKTEVQANLRSLIKYFNELYYSSRKENASVEMLNEILSTKRHLLDLFEQCSKCKKEEDHVNRGLSELIRKK